MLNKATTLKGYTLHSLDGAIGKVTEFYFDDQYWVIRYLIADTGTWLMERQVLISPHALAAVSKEDQHIAVALTRTQIENSPSLNSDKPVSRQFEGAYYQYYGWPLYWNGPKMGGLHPNIVRNHDTWRESTQGEKAWDPHLRSTHNLSGYHIHAADGQLGHVDDCLIDDETWAIRYLIVDTRNGCPGKKILVTPEWIDRVSWSESQVFVNLSREMITHSPEYTEESLLTRDYQTGLHRHYNRLGYWGDEPAGQTHSG